MKALKSPALASRGGHMVRQGTADGRDASCAVDRGAFSPPVRPA
jgi:hypothetical protein